MTDPNRVTPWGEVVAAPGRGAWMGNRGCLHPRDGAHRIARLQTTTRWITCVLSFRGRHVAQWVPGRYTPLFFLDEAVALAAGHRPCAECRRADFDAYRSAWAAAHGGSLPRAREIDARLAGERLPAGCDRPTHRVAWRELSSGVVTVVDATAMTVDGDRLLPWRPDCTYGPPVARPARGDATVLTPPANVGALLAGYAARPLVGPLGR